jgi:deazaflavin-dependent oxidoreductase (nitroreductase family)
MNETTHQSGPAMQGAADGPPRRLVNATAPIARALAGRRWMPLWALIRHRGRRSGIAYETPIAVVPTTDASIVMIGLPWGATTNWARNVVAADGASLRRRRRGVELGHPRIVDGMEASRLAKASFRAVLKRSLQRSCSTAADQASNCPRSPVTDRGSPVAGHLSPVAGHRSPVACRRSPVTAHRALSTEH